ncbi:hypothetical protein [Pontibacter sp. BAB1700]
MFATMYGRNNMVKFMLDQGANRELRDARGLTAQQMAAQVGNEEALKLFETSTESTT